MNLKCSLSSSLRPTWSVLPEEMDISKKVNRAVINTLGYSREELMSFRIDHFVHPDDLERTRRRRQAVLEGEALLNFENRYLTKNGGVVWLHWTSLYSSEHEAVFAIAKNVTLKKLREKEIEAKLEEYRNLVSHFKTGLEQDKKELATEMHESLAQLATVAMLDLDWLHEHCTPDDREAKERIQQARSALDLLMRSIRQLSYTISPKMLEDLGLNDTLEWLCEDFSRQHGIPCLFEGLDAHHELAHEMQLDLFRITQAALRNNAIKGADRIEVALHAREGGITLCITEYGEGSAEQDTSLQGILERAASMNAGISWEAIEEGSSRVKVTVNI